MLKIKAILSILPRVWNTLWGIHKRWRLLGFGVAVCGLLVTASAVLLFEVDSEFGHAQSPAVEAKSLVLSPIEAVANTPSLPILEEAIALRPSPPSDPVSPFPSARISDPMEEALPLFEAYAGIRSWSNRDAHDGLVDPSALGELDGSDLRFLSDLIAANGLTEASSAGDYDNGDGLLEPLEVGLQVWLEGRLVEFQTGPSRYASFGYELQHIPASVGNADALEFLDLNSNRLAALPDSLSELYALEDLVLYNNQLEEIPGGVIRLTALWRLVLSENLIKEIAPEIATLATLEELHLNDNPLRELPPEIALLPELRTLNLRDAELSELPEWLFEMQRLESLQLAANRIDCHEPKPSGSLEFLESSPVTVYGLKAQRCTRGRKS